MINNRLGCGVSNRWMSMARDSGLSSTTRTRDIAARGATGLSLPSPSLTVNVKMLPTPGWLVTQMSPPISCASRLQMVRPRPVPPYFRVIEVSAWRRGDLLHVVGRAVVDDLELELRGAADDLFCGSLVFKSGQLDDKAVGSLFLD